MLTGFLLLAFAFAILLGTVVAVMRLDATETATWWQRFWRIYTGWMAPPGSWASGDAPAMFRLHIAGDMKAQQHVPWGRYCLLFTMATSALYGLAFFADQSPGLHHVLAFLVARISSVLGAVLAWPGMGWGIGACLGELGNRAALRFLVLFPVFLTSFVLLFLHPFGFAGFWLPVAEIFG